MKGYLSLPLLILIPLSLFAKDLQKTEEIINTILRNDIRVSRPEKDDSKGKDPGKDQKYPEKGKVSKSKEKKETTSDEILYKIGIQNFNTELYEAAVKNFTELKSKFPQSDFRDNASIWSGKSHVKLGKYDEALKDFSSIAEGSGEYYASLFYQGDTYQRMGQNYRAVELYHRLASLHPTYELADDALIRTGYIYLQERKGKQALEAAITVIKRYSHQDMVDDAYYLIGKVYEKDPQLRDIEMARKIYKIFLKKAERGDRYFVNSPLRRRVSSDLKYIEASYFKLEK